MQLGHLKRREFIALLGGVAAWPVVVRAQELGLRRRVTVITSDYETDREVQARIAAFKERLAERGWVEGRNVWIDVRWSVDIAHIRSKLPELISLKPDAILSLGTPVTAALQRQTSTVPIVFTLVADPIASGLVASLAHPGANITGFTNFEYSIGGKWLQVLTECAPRIRRVLVIQNPENAGAAGLLREIDFHARSLGVLVATASTLPAPEMEHIIEEFARQPDGGLIVLPDATTSNLRASIIASAVDHRTPAIYPFRYFASSGGLIAYGIDTVDPFRQAASYVDLILNGAKPADLPVQAPTKFELVINLRTAKALGLTVPPQLLGRADELIE